MSLQETNSSHHNIYHFAREKFSDLAKKQINKLNPKLRNK
ncbi:unnamed protein product, partial [Rotaria sp. Silwood2]